MTRFIHYYSRFQGLRGRMGGLPSWARALVALAALPGIALAGLSLLALAVSILALFLLTTPVYRLLVALTGSDAGGNAGASARVARPMDVVSESVEVDENDVVITPAETKHAPRRQIDVTIIE